MIETHLVHESTVEPYLGTSGSGERYGPPVPYPCLIEDEIRLVRDETGSEVVSRTTVTYGPDALRKIPVRSWVTIGDERRRVISVSNLDSGGLTDLDHVEVALA